MSNTSIDNRMIEEFKKKIEPLGISIGDVTSLEQVAPGVFKFEIEDDEGDYLSAERVIINPPATIVIWSDGSKTVSKARGGDPYLPVLGLMCCALRRLSRNRGRFVDQYEDLLTLMEDLHLSPGEMDMLSDVLWVTASLMRTNGGEAAMQRPLDLDEG